MSLSAFRRVTERKLELRVFDYGHRIVETQQTLCHKGAVENGVGGGAKQQSKK